MSTNSSSAVQGGSGQAGPGGTGDGSSLCARQPQFDCERCGACCHQRPGTILVEPQDLERWRRAGCDHLLASVEPGHLGMQAFMMRDGHCVHLGLPDNPAACRIYPDRATVCREFQAGSRQCLEFRRLRGR